MSCTGKSPAQWYTYCLSDLAFHWLTQKSLKNKRVSKFLCLKIRKDTDFMGKKQHQDNENHSQKNIVLFFKYFLKPQSHILSQGRSSETVG